MRPQVDDMYVSDFTPATLAKAVNLVREWGVMFLAVRIGRRAAIRLHHHLQRNPPTCEGCPLMEPRRGSLEELVWEGWCFSVPAIPYRKGADLGHSAFSSGIIQVRLDTGMPDGKACVVHTDYCQPHFFEGGFQISLGTGPKLPVEVQEYGHTYWMDNQLYVEPSWRLDAILKEYGEYRCQISKGAAL